MKIVGLIQARMRSTRLSGKVMLDILGKPVLWHIFNRLRHCNFLDLIVISTGECTNNMAICEFASKNNIPFYAGSETDLIDRLYKTAVNFDASAIVRITADCPLVDPKVIDKLVSEFIKNKDQYDIVRNWKNPSFPHGLEAEVYSFEILKKMWEEIREPEIREWFALYPEREPNSFRILNIANSENLSNFRWTIDYPEDYDFVKQIYQNLYKENEIFYMQDILNLIKKRPELIEINAMHVGNRNVGMPKV